ncbi:MAG TPA: hypothetical protein PLL11_08535 [Spirochaetota bacterium]|nr:hypothetical protein [Spirochaetota bacterium]
MDKLQKVSALYGIISSACMMLLWALLFISGAARDIIDEGSAGTAALVVAEALTSALLLISGIGLMRGRQWAPALYHVSMGMLLYAVVFVAGKFAGTDYAFSGILFILVAAATIIILCLRIFGRHATGQGRQ